MLSERTDEEDHRRPSPSPPSRRDVRGTARPPSAAPAAPPPPIPLGRRRVCSTQRPSMPDTAPRDERRTPAEPSAPSCGSIPSCRPALPRIVLGMVAALLAASSRSPSRWCCRASSTARCRPATAAQIWPAAIIVLVLGALEAGLILAAPLVRADARHARRGAPCATRLYAKLQDLPVAFHDRWQSGQLLSRADERPRPHPALARLRRRAAGREHHDGADRLRRAVLLELDAGAGLPGLLDPALDLRLRVREQVLGRRPPRRRISRATSRPPSRSRCTASGC